MKKNMINTIMVATSILMLSACGGDDNEKKDEPVVVIDTSGVQQIDEINTTTYICQLGDELVLDNNASDFTIDDDQNTLEWKMTLDTGKIKDLRVDECKINTGEKRLCFQVNPEKPGTGMYQKILTEAGKRYRVEAELIGADNVDFKNDFDLGSSYVSIEDAKPKEKSEPLALSNLIKGNTPTVVQFDFNATKDEMYVQLRGDKERRYPTAFYISVKELKIMETNNTNDNSSKVPCNL